MAEILQTPVRYPVRFELRRLEPLGDPPYLRVEDARERYAAARGLTVADGADPLAEALDAAKSDSPARRPLGGTRAGRLVEVTPIVVVGVPVVAALIAGFIAASAWDASDRTYGRTLVGDQPLAALGVVGDPALLPPYADPGYSEGRAPNIETLSLDFVRDAMARTADGTDAALLPERLELVVALLPMNDYVTVRPHERDEDRVQFDFLGLVDAYPRIKNDAAAAYPATIDPVSGNVRPGHAILPLWIDDDGSYGVGLPLTGTLSTGVDSRLGAYDFVATEPATYNHPGTDSSIAAGWLVASKMSDLGREMEYNDLRTATLPSSTVFWIVALATWTGVQALAMIGWSIAQLLLGHAGSRRTRKQLRALRAELNTLALGLDLSRLDAVAVLGNTDDHRGKAAEADQQLYETMLFTAWREVQALEALPRREQRGQEWRTRVERMGRVIDSLAQREKAVAERALTFIRSYT